MMVRSHANTASRQRTHSIANPTVYQSAPRDVKPDRRSKTFVGNGQQGTTTCPVCGAEVTLRKPQAFEVSKKTGILKGDLLLSQHRVGGGRYSARRGDARCKGSDTREVD